MKVEHMIALLRITLGLIFLWAFFDKLLGLGFATSPDKSWLKGFSPTAGFLKIVTYGPFSSIFHGLAGSAVVDWLFMLGLLGIGVALILGICVTIASVSGILMVSLMWLSMFPPKNNPLIDEHIFYVLIFLLVLTANSTQVLGMGKWWVKTELVEKNPILR